MGALSGSVVIITEAIDRRRKGKGSPVKEMLHPALTPRLIYPHPVTLPTIRYAFLSLNHGFMLHQRAEERTEENGQ
jgi:hypothetical protein